MSTLRWNPMLGEWIIVTPKRAERPFQDLSIKCPFCPDSQETGTYWKVLTLDNKYSALDSSVGVLPLDEQYIMEAPAHGYCKVIILSPNHEEQLEQMDEEQVESVFKEYLSVFRELDTARGIEYVFEFENRGKSIGVSLDHPHAQAYALPFIPTRIRQELKQFQEKWENEKKCLVCEILENELKTQASRIINETAHFVSFVPFFAKVPYEVHIYPREHVASLVDLEDKLLELGTVVQDVVCRYSRVFDEIAYVMAFHTRPSTGEHPYWHFHIELYPPWRDRSRLKYLAGLETGAGTYTNDSSPEDIAAELRDAL
ncbi:galactose-1-phosphate uridylyltransferase [Candidatus Thorarchaeota archaeon]|nr:MAG: galactose-1-phosphate uridylyltransferase [Candidatus Thorarchaeota archaeon]